MSVETHPQLPGDTNDSYLLDWMEKTRHVLCYQDGEWFCAWRGDDGYGWTDRPMRQTVREAIVAAMFDVDMVPRERL
jgi:hypothetical protein